MNRLHRLVGLSFSTLSLLLAAGCGGSVKVEEPADTGSGIDSATTSDSSSPDSIVPESGTDIGSETVEAGIDSPPPTPKTCDAMTAAICGTDTAPCCTKHGFTWSEAGCKAVIAAYCGGQVDAVKAGTMTYDESYLDACTKSWASEMKTCDMDFITYLKSSFACAQLFNGTKAPGDSCDPRGYECKAPKGASAYCDQTAKKCRVYTVVAKGEGCNYLGSTIRYCDTGLYCDVTSPTSTCQPALKTGEACDGPDDPACGLYNYCKDNKCAPGLASGVTCGTNPECASYVCKGGTCTDPSITVVSSYICTGGP